MNLTKMTHPTNKQNFREERKIKGKQKMLSSKIIIKIKSLTLINYESIIFSIFYFILLFCLRFILTVNFLIYLIHLFLTYILFYLLFMDPQMSFIRLTTFTHIYFYHNFLIHLWKAFHHLIYIKSTVYFIIIFCWLYFYCLI